MPKGEVVNGEASLIYPGFAPRYGPNDPSAAPVSSLRMESMRDGIEDVNLVTRYRQRFGDKAVKARYAKIFGGLYTLPGTGFVWQKYSNVDMARRLEENRRAMITQLEAAGG